MSNDKKCYVYLNASNKDIGESKKLAMVYIKKNYPDYNALFIIDDLNIKINWNLRRIGTLLKEIKTTDKIIVVDAHDLTCSTAQILSVLAFACSYKIEIDFVRHDIKIYAEDYGSAFTKLLKLIGKIESAFVSKRTLHSLALRKYKGLPLGRPKGKGNKSLKLDKFKPEIQRYLDLGISKASMSKLIDCHPQTIYNYINRMNLHKSNIDK